jgi:N-acetylmuramoyl-L-alanine amidase
VFAIVLLGVCIFASRAIIPCNNAVESQVVDIILDAGHGSFDGGAIGVSGAVEKDLNLAITLKIRDILVQNGVNVLLTRDSDVMIKTDKKTIREKKREDLYYRRDFMAKSNARLFVSIHINKFEQQKYRGAQVFYSKNKPESEELAKLVQNALKNGINDGNNREAKAADDGVFLLKQPPMPAILIECGFLSNREEEALLCTEEYQQQMAQIIARAIQDWLEKNAMQ